MYFFEYIIESFSAIRTNKLRSGLSLIGIIVGITSVVVLIGLGNGMKENMIKSFSATNNIITIAQGQDYSVVGPDSSSQSHTTSSYAIQEGTRKLFSEKMVDTLRIFLRENIKAIIPVYESINAQLLYNGQYLYASILPATSDLILGRNLQIKDGIFFSDTMIDEEQRVLVLGFGLVSQNFAGESPLGKTISINGRPFQVVGIFDKTGDYSMDGSIFIPFSLAKEQFGLKKINRIEVLVYDVTQISRTQKQLKFLLDKFFPTLSDQIYHLQTNERFLEEIQKSINSMTLFIVSIAGISLFVGGIGIMNVMLVSVTERTREIGIRKAIGATRFDIMLQFLIESGTITCIGGIIAIILSYIIGNTVVRFLPDFAFSIDLSIVFFATGFSILMGVIFGLLPAWKAARMKPIDALRFE